MCIAVFVWAMVAGVVPKHMTALPRGSGLSRLQVEVGVGTCWIGCEEAGKAGKTWWARREAQRLPASLQTLPPLNRSLPSTCCGLSVGSAGSETQGMVVEGSITPLLAPQVFLLEKSTKAMFFETSSLDSGKESGFSFQ